MDGLEEDGKITSWRVCHISAGYYQVTVGSTNESDDLEKIVDLAIKQVLEVKSKIPIDKVPIMTSEIG